jgi:hypothetical protein
MDEKADLHLRKGGKLSKNALPADAMMNQAAASVCVCDNYR